MTDDIMGLRRKTGHVFQDPKPFAEKKPASLDHQDLGALGKIIKEGLWFDVASLDHPAHSFQNLRILLRCSEQELLRDVNEFLRGTSLSALPMDDERIFFAIQHASEKGLVELKEDKVVPYDPRKPKLV